MTDIALKFEAKPEKGSNYDMYETLIDVSSEQTNFKLEVPPGYEIMGIKFYQLTEIDGGGGFTRPSAWDDDFSELHKGHIEATFTNPNGGFITLPPNGWSWNAATSTLTDTGASEGAWDYIIWIHKEGGPYGHNGHDWIDPGVRNHGRNN